MATSDKYYFIDFPLVGEIITAVNISRNSKLSPDSLREGEKYLHNQGEKMIYFITYLLAVKTYSLKHEIKKKC